MLHRALVGLALASLLLSLATSIAGEYFSAENRSAMANTLDLDRTLVTSANGQAIFLRLVGFEGSAGALTSNIYFRAVYDLYPLQVAEAEPSAVLNTWQQVLAANFNPPAEWLSQHQIPRKLTLLQSNGELAARAEAVQMVSPARDDSQRSHAPLRAGRP